MSHRTKKKTNEKKKIHDEIAPLVETEWILYQIYDRVGNDSIAL